uniref:MADF domain-containing protein n=1 Tax=Glossina brevipalpis TaxID=37001 RepID=A0A1A9WCE1_9MUSC
MMDPKYQQHQHHSLSKSINGAEENRQYLRAFIQTYRNLPVLWDTSLRDYTNRDKRAEAYQQLVPIYRYLKRDANLEDVKKKINTLRTNYRKELKVVESARREGNVYQPRCWTFYELDFLRNAEKFLAVNPQIKSENAFLFNEHSPNQFLEASLYGFRSIACTPPPNISEMFHKSFGQTPAVNTQQKVEHQAASTPPLGALPGGQQVTNNHGNPVTATQLYQQQQQQQQQQSQHHNSQNLNSAPHMTAKRLRANSHANGHGNNPSRSPSNETLAMACDYLSSSYPEEESLARTWTYKLKRLARDQRLLAEKFISDVLFEAESGTLHRGSMQLNALEPYVRFEDNTSDEATENEKSQSPSNQITNNSSRNLANCVDNATAATQPTQGSQKVEMELQKSETENKFSEYN